MLVFRSLCHRLLACLKPSQNDRLQIFKSALNVLTLGKDWIYRDKYGWLVVNMKLNKEPRYQIVIEHIFKSYDEGATFAVNDVSLSVKEGEFLVILGSSGSGKSTLLKMINRLVPASAGKILINDEDVTDRDIIKHRRDFGYVFQGIGLFPHFSVFDNVTIQMHLQRVPYQIRKERASELLNAVRLPPEVYGSRFPHELSGGERQRVGVARSLAMDPAYLLMDEPFGALDAVTREQLQEEVIELWQTLQKTVVFVTHDIFEALKLGERIAIMDGGRLQQVGEASELINSPSSEFVEKIFRRPLEQFSKLSRIV